jgi:hypothetical protein
MCSYGPQQRSNAKKKEAPVGIAARNIPSLTSAFSKTKYGRGLSTAMAGDASVRHLSRVPSFSAIVIPPFF